MEILFLTVFLSLILAVIFIISFAIYQGKGGESNPERDSLMPFREEDDSFQNDK